MPPKPTIDSLHFDTTGWKYHGEREPGHFRLWQTPDLDAVALYFFDLPPDYPNFQTVADLGEFHSPRIKAAGGEMVECALATVAKCSAIRLIIKVPQQPHGRSYQATFTLPFRDFSYVIKIQCHEHGITGFRENVLFERRMAAGETPVITGGPFFENWNPDASEHDAEFPTHPISRSRRLLKHIAACATLDEEIAKLPPFPLPASSDHARWR